MSGADGEQRLSEGADEVYSKAPVFAGKSESGTLLMCDVRASRHGTDYYQRSPTGFGSKLEQEIPNFTSPWSPRVQVYLSAA